MPRTHAYGILDLFALVSKLLAPFTDAIRAEFAVKAVDRPRQTTPPQPAPTPAPVGEPATPIVTVTAVADTLPVHVVLTLDPMAVDFTVSTSAGIPADSPAVRGSVIGIPTTVGANGTVQIPADPTSEAGIPATTAADPAPLFVRRKTGGQWRYHVAQSDAPGQKFRRLTAGNRVRYEPLNATSQESAR